MKIWCKNKLSRRFGKYCRKQTILETHFFKKERGFANGIVGYIGDGYCKDENNNAGCHFDGGDCCGVNINTQNVVSVRRKIR